MEEGRTVGKRKPISLARRERKRLYDREYKKNTRRSTINIKGEIVRWNNFKTIHNVSDDEQVAQMLLDHYDMWKISHLTHEVEEMNATNKKQKAFDDPTTLRLPEYNSVEVDFDVTVQLRDGSRCKMDELYIKDDGATFMDDYVPDSIQVKLKNNSTNLDGLDVVRPVEDFEINYDYLIDEADGFIGNDQINKTDGHINIADDYMNLADVKKEHIYEAADQIMKADEVNNFDEEMTSYSKLLKERLSIAYDCQLIALSKLSIPSKCKQCGSTVNVKSQRIGSSTVLTWICSSGHEIDRWCSQPVVKHTNLGDLMLATNILLSGNDFDKISMLFKFMNMGCVSESTFSEIQDSYCVPAITGFWEKMVQYSLDRLRGQDLVLTGDGQSYSIDDNAKFLNYSVMENSTGLVLQVNTVHGKECDEVSNELEVLALKLALSALEEDGQIIKELVTFSNEQIKSFLDMEKPYIKHSLDMLHGVEALAEQISKSTVIEENRKLALWTEDILTYFWWCCKYCKGNIAVLWEHWQELLQHIMSGNKTDDHSMSAQSEEPESELYLALKKIVFGELKSLPYYVNFRQTEELESFLNSKSFYINERHTFSSRVSHARCLLAAIDYNWNLEREDVKDDEGNIRYGKQYSKRTKTWKAVPLKFAKTYDYIPKILSEILCRCAATNTIPSND